MSTFPGSPRTLKGGIVLVHPDTGVVQRVIALQYNADALTRSLQVQAAGGGEGADHSEVLRLKGPPVETIKLEAELDATDQLGRADPDPTAGEFGVHPQLAALETIVYPDSGRLRANNELASAGTLEIVPAETPLALFVWSKSRVVPVRVTEFSVTEEAFDANLNPIRAKVSLGMRVLSVNDLGFNHRGGSLFMVYLQQKEKLSLKAQGPGADALGITGSL